MLRVSFACALLAAGAPAAEATLGNFFSGASKTEESDEENGIAKLNKLDWEKLRLDNVGLDRLYTGSPAFADFKLDLPPLKGGLGVERFTLPGHDSAFPTEGKTGLNVGLQELKQQLAHSLPQLESRIHVGSSEGTLPPSDAKTGLKLDLQELKEQLSHSLPQFKSKIHMGSGEDTLPLPLPLLPTSVSSAHPDTQAFTKGGESLGRLGQLFKQRDQPNVIPSLSWIGKKERKDFDAAGPTATEEATVAAHTDENVPENESPPATSSAHGKSNRGLFPELKNNSLRVPGRFNEHGFTIPDFASSGVKLLKFSKPTNKQGNGAYPTESAHSSKTGELDAKSGVASTDLSRAPVRRLTLLPVLGAALQRIDRKTKRDEETFQAFERGVKQLQTDIKHDLASTLGTRRRPADPLFVERLLAKVGLNGLGGPSPIDLSLQERAIMDQARRKRLQVEKIKSKYERDIKYLVDELHSSLKGPNSYKQRISDLVNDKMYTKTALLSV